MTHLTRLASILFFFVLAGCGAESDQRFSASADALNGGTTERFAFELPASSGSDLIGGRMSWAQRDAGGEQGVLAGDPATATERKIIYVAQVSLVVEDFDKIERELPQLVKQFGGYLADTTIDRTQGAYRTGQWMVRIPVENYEDFLLGLEKLGIPEHRTQTAQDVTEEFVDLEARIANKQKLEQRILQLVDDRDGKIKDVIEVERELARVREEIERMVGRLRYLANRAALTTVTITVREEKDYVPPQAPSFTSRIGTAWTYSTQNLLKFGENTVVELVAFSPWLVIWIPIILLACWGWKRLRTRLFNRPAAVR